MGGVMVGRSRATAGENLELGGKIAFEKVNFGNVVSLLGKFCRKRDLFWEFYNFTPLISLPYSHVTDQMSGIHQQ